MGALAKYLPGKVLTFVYLLKFRRNCQVFFGDDAVSNTNPILGPNLVEGGLDLYTGSFNYWTPCSQQTVKRVFEMLKER